MIINVLACASWTERTLGFYVSDWTGTTLAMCCDYGGVYEEILVDLKSISNYLRYWVRNKYLSIHNNHYLGKSTTFLTLSVNEIEWLNL